MSKTVCKQQKQIICEFCKLEEYKNCQSKKCENLNLPEGAELYLFDNVEKRDGNEEKGIYELYLKKYHNLSEFFNKSEPAKVDYILFYPSKKIILLIEISDLYRKLLKFLKNKLITEVKNFPFQKITPKRFRNNLRNWINTYLSNINDLNQLKKFLENDFITLLQQHVNVETIESFKQKFWFELDNFWEEFVIQEKNELIKKIDDTLRVFEIFFEKIGKADLFDFYWKNFKLKVILIVSRKGYHQVIFSLISRIKLQKLKYKNVICDNCQSMENFQRSIC